MSPLPFLTSVAALSGAALLCLVPTASTQAQAVVQQLPNPATEKLNEAMRRLSRNPESLPALIDAGRASIELGDVDAAEGLFNRALAVDSRNGSALAGQAVVSLRKQEPVQALELFDRAQAAGEDLAPYAADQGLAYDLVGDNARAQQLYDVALSRGESTEVLRRLALSHAIAGDQAAFEAVLLPLLQRRDLAAYRTRAFGLAILGREEEAITIAETRLPQRLSRRMEPYLRFMPQLTPAQQAMAANLGRFPAAADMGRDNLQLAHRATQPAEPRPSNGADQRLIPGGQPLGRNADPEEQVAEVVEELPALASAANAALPPAPPPPRETSVVAEVAQVEQRADQRGSPPAPAAAQTDREPVELLPSAAPGFSIAQRVAAQTEAPAEAVEEQVSLADAFADFSLPAADAPVRPAAGAVDITAFEPTREVREPEPPPPPAHPSRHWVQVATGQDTAAFRFDWRRISRSANGALDGFSPYRASWNATNRLLTGPFDSTGEAQRFVTRLAEEGINAFRFTSAEGEEVIAIN